MTIHTSPGSGKSNFGATVDNLLEPLLDVIRYYPNGEFERRTLIFTWVANLVKPMAAIEVANILGYDYRRIRELFMRLGQSAVLSEAGNKDSYSCVGDETLTLYVPKGIIKGRPLPGRLPTMFVFKKRADVDPEAFRQEFNQFGLQIVQYAEQKVMALAEEIAPEYRQALLSDWKFIVEKIANIIRMLVHENIMSLNKEDDHTEVEVKLRHGKIDYAVPMVKQLKPLF
jgi:hypothetical protein